MAASKMKITDRIMPIIQPLLYDTKTPRTPSSIKKTRSSEKLDFGLIGAPHFGHVDAAVEMLF
jgi:hypothetical protein